MMVGSNSHSSFKPSTGTSRVVTFYKENCLLTYL
jgi:hypothetical protein